MSAELRPNEGAGRFVARFRLRTPGTYRVNAVHGATAAIGRSSAEGGQLEVVRPSIDYGDRGALVRAIQHQLAKLHYVTSRSGVYDSATGRAIRAFRGVNGMAKLTIPSRAVLVKLAQGRGAFNLRFPHHGRHVEADLSEQVVVLANRGEVERILITAPGAPSTPTVRGSHRFYHTDFGYNSLGMLHSAYFVHGYAIHGYLSVPPYPASHGCLRIPLVNALSVFRWIRIGDRIDVYR